jgi:hypothetical protein
VPIRSVLLIYLCNVLYFVSLNNGKIAAITKNILGGGGENDIIIYNDKSGRGLMNDNDIIENQFKMYNLPCINSNPYDKNWDKYREQFNVFIHQQNIRDAAIAKYHIWIPNQELIRDWDLDRLRYIDLIVCKTHETKRKMEEICNNMMHSETKISHDTKGPTISKSSTIPRLNKIPKIIYTGFTTVINPNFNINEKIERKSHNIRKIFKVVHFGGSSAYKNTVQIINTWINSNLIDDISLELVITLKLSEPYMEPIKTVLELVLKQIGDVKINQNPQGTDEICKYGNMTIFNSYDNIEELYKDADIALCLSSNEGFGHYINEAIYYGCVPLVVNAPPMNEYFNEPRFQDYLVNVDELKSNDFIHGVINANYICKHDISRTKAYMFDEKDFVVKFNNIKELLKIPDETRLRLCELNNLYNTQKIYFNTNFKDEVIHEILNINFDKLEYITTTPKSNLRTNPITYKNEEVQPILNNNFAPAAPAPAPAAQDRRFSEAPRNTDQPWRRKKPTEQTPTHNQDRRFSAANSRGTGFSNNNNPSARDTRAQSVSTPAAPPTGYKKMQLQPRTKPLP